MTIEEKQNQIIDEFSMFSDWMEKYEYIIELGKDLPLIDAQFKTPENIIKGCQSQVWLHADLVDGKIVFTADSDAVITKGIISLLISVLSGHSPKEVAEAELFFIDKIGLKEHLSPTRSNGLLSMVKQMKMYGIAFQAKV
jgi:cysteine desulfuration protein SufE